jgi:tetratricopeptide (TPR) repeat protein
MRANAILAGTLAALILSVASPVFAQGSDDRTTCEDDKADGKIAACTRLLNDRALPIKDREKFLNERGVGYFRKKEWDLALTDFSEAIGINPRDNVLWANRADTYRNKKEFKLALEDSKKSIELNPKNKRNYYVRGLIYYDDNKYDFAIPEFGEAIKLDAKYDEAFYYRGRSFFLKKDYKAAIPDFSKSIELDPKYAPTWFYRGLSYERLEDLDQALKDYNQAIVIDNGHGSARHNRGMIKLARGDYDGAIEDFTVSIRTSADEITHNSRGVAYRNKGEFALAMNDFNEAIRFDPKYARPYYHRGMLHSRAGSTDLAVADLRKAVELDPKSKEARDALARAEAMLASVPRQSQQQQQRPQQQQQQQQSSVQALSNLPQALQQQLTQPQAQAPGTSQGGKRVALVIGNSNYQFSSKLSNPGNDAQDISTTLRQIGFEVVEGRDLDRRGMDDAIRQFSRKLDGAGLAILFYSGHGVQVNERNYLIPTDARIERAADLNLDAFDLQRIIDQMETEKRVNLIFLDACRDNPLTRSLARNSGGGTRSAAVGMGLAPVQSAAGTLIAYATQPNNVALDGDGRNSPFTTALLKYMVVPNLEVELMMKQVRLDVMAATREKQVPWGHSSLVGNVFLRSQ